MLIEHLRQTQCGLKVIMARYRDGETTLLMIKGSNFDLQRWAYEFHTALELLGIVVVFERKIFSEGLHC